MEAETHHKLRNQPRSKASLTAARTNANAIYCPPLLQAQIDLMSGTIHGDEKDFDTAFEPPTPTLTLTLTPTLTPNPNPNPNPNPDQAHTLLSDLQARRPAPTP